MLKNDLINLFLFFLEMPLGQVPILEVDGIVVYQHMAICRYLGKIVDLVGENEWEDLQIDMMADTINEFRLSKCREAENLNKV